MSFLDFGGIGKTTSTRTTTNTATDSNNSCTSQNLGSNNMINGPVENKNNSDNVTVQYLIAKGGGGDGNQSVQNDQNAMGPFGLPDPLSLLKLLFGGACGGGGGGLASMFRAG